jgi:hypothetical protein
MTNTSLLLVCLVAFGHGEGAARAATGTRVDRAVVHVPWAGPSLGTTGSPADPATEGEDLDDETDAPGLRRDLAPGDGHTRGPVPNARSVGVSPAATRSPLLRC